MSSEAVPESRVQESAQTLGTVSELVVLLAEVHVSLAVASNEQELLGAVMRYITRSSPSSVFLHYVHVGESGRPNSVEAAAFWSDGKLQTEHPAYGQRQPLDSYRVAKLFIDNPHDLVAIEDVATDPRCDAKLREELGAAGLRGMVIMPLYSVGHSSWQGMLSVNWKQPHPLDAEERFIFSMFMATLASFLANQRSERALRETLREKHEQSALLQAVLDNLPVGLAVVEAQTGKPQLQNRMAVKVLGRGIDPQTSKDHYAELYHCLRPGSDERMPNEELPLCRTLDTAQTHSGDVDVIGEDDRRRMLEVTAAPILDENGRMHNAVLLMVDATSRKTAEKERQRMQDELITMQAAALAERSTPLIPITEEIVVVPLIGSLDSERGNQLLDTLLTGVSQNRARVAIIDITGIRTLDTQAASTLTGAAQALRLLGVEPVLTGIRAEVAQTLVTLGVRLDGIATRNNLQSGIALAQKFVEKKSHK
jgi:anti-anti-sigma regulatory factor/PAS domain-containing protein